MYKTRWKTLKFKEFKIYKSDFTLNRGRLKGRFYGIKFSAKQGRPPLTESQEHLNSIQLCLDFTYFTNLYKVFKVT